MANNRGWHHESARHSLAARGMKTRCPKKSYDSGPEGRRYVQLEMGRDTRPLEPSMEEMQGEESWWEDHIEWEAKALMKENPDLDESDAIEQATINVERKLELTKSLEARQDELENIYYEIEDYGMSPELGQKQHKKVKEIDIIYKELQKFERSPSKSYEKWYTHKKHTGWKKTQLSTTRRQRMLASTPKNWTSEKRYRLAGRRMQALANVTTDKRTSTLAKSDARYFFNKLKEMKT